MKPIFTRFGDFTLAATLVGLAVLSSAPVSAALKPVATNAPPAELVIARSIFLLPSAPAQGRDPFFPLSTRPYASFMLAKTNNASAAPVPVTAELHLNGISGTAGRPLAIINNRTFEVGELGEISSNLGRVRIRCLEIRPDAVVVQIGAERRVVHMRSGI